MALIVPGKYVKRELQLNLTTHEGKVIIQFDRPTQEVLLEPSQAIELGSKMQAAAGDLIRKGLVEE